MSEQDNPLAAQTVHIFKSDCVNCLYVNPKGDKHYPCHHTKPNRKGQRNIECPAGKIVFVVGFTPELWAERYVKAQASGDNQRIIRIIQKVDGQDETTQQTFWSMVQVQTAVAMGAVLIDDDEGDDVQDTDPPTAEPIVEDGIDPENDEAGEGTGEFDDENAQDAAEADQPEEAAGEATAESADEDDDWNE